jgi:hypothetical protein
MADDLAQFDREMEAIEARLPTAIRDALVSIVADVAYPDIIERSPVRTGAYRAEHIIGVGRGEAIAQILYEAPNRVGPDAIPQLDAGAVLEPPNAQAAKVQMSAVRPFVPLVILNQRFYASLIEYGTGSMEPRQVYEGARQRVNALPPIPLRVEKR